MAVDGIEYLYLETRDFGRSVEFWQHLGFELVLDLGRAGRLEPAGGGPGIFLDEVSPETPLASGVFLKAGSAGLDVAVEKVGQAVASHWNTTLQVVRDPDGREFVLQHTPNPG